jgi:hypothetical protein
MGGIGNSPEVNLLKQVRHALGDVREAQKTGDVMRIYYITWCMQDMVNRGNRSWSQYRPMIDEEFDD